MNLFLTIALMNDTQHRKRAFMTIVESKGQAEPTQQWSLVNKGKRKVQGVPQSQTDALPTPQEEEENGSGLKINVMFPISHRLVKSQPTAFFFFFFLLLFFFFLHTT